VLFILFILIMFRKVKIVDNNIIMIVTYRRVQVTILIIIYFKIFYFKRFIFYALLSINKLIIRKYYFFKKYERKCYKSFINTKNFIQKLFVIKVRRKFVIILLLIKTFKN
jgi:hypothetical protein